MSEWQPIKTAPKDGTDVLIWHPANSEMFVAFWEGDGWQYAAGEFGAVLLDGGETHWQPLPPPPIDTAN